MTNQPNVVLLMMDSVRAANMSCYGYHRATTPNIDQLAQQGTLYEQAISVGCWTLPVHASLFTGLYPRSHGVTVSKDALPGNFPTLASQLRGFGYQTASFSNNAYISEMTGLTQGFDTCENIWQLTNPRGIQRTKMGRLIRRLEQYGPPAKPAIRLARGLQKAHRILKSWRNRRDKGAHVTNEKIKAWLTESRNPYAPCFLFVQYMDCHLPYNPPYPYNRRFMPNNQSPARVARMSKNKGGGLNSSEGDGQEDIISIQALYDGQLYYLDHRIGELVGFLASLDILDDTVLIITSDHGDSLGEHNQIGHRMALYEPLVRIPLLIRYPARFQPGARVTQQVSLIDLYATMLELAGADHPEVQSNGVQSLIRPIDDGARGFTIAENTAPKSHDNVVARMLRSERYKYIWKSDQQHELYDLANDPEELVNLVAIETEVARLMDEQLQKWNRSLEHHRIEPVEAEYDEAIMDRLRALGYAE